MNGRRAKLLSLLAVIAILLSTAVAWSCALWSPMPASRALTKAEATTFLTDGFGSVTLSPAPSGLQHSGLGVELILAGDTGTVTQIRRTPPKESRPSRPGSSTFTLVPTGPDGKWVHIVRAGWPLQCLEGATRAEGSNRERHGLVSPPPILDDMGVKPRRMLPLYPRWAGLVGNMFFYAAICWLVVPGPRVIRGFLRRRRALCPGCGYDLRHHEHATCPECGTRVAR